jgi:hypothetical protein
MGSTATPRLKAGALQHTPRRPFGSALPGVLRPGGLIPNPLVSAGDGPPVRLDAILAGQTAVLTARRPDAGLEEFCRRHGLALVRISSSPGRSGADPDAGWTDVHLAADPRPACLQALAANPALTVIVRPDRVIAAVEPQCRLPRLPWPTPAAATRTYPALARPPAHPSPTAS